MTDETLKQGNDILNAIADLSKQINGRIDDLEKRLDGIDTRLDGIDTRLDGIDTRLDAHDLQFEAIRQGIVYNGIDFERLSAKVSNLSADVRELTEEVRKDKLALK